MNQFLVGTRFASFLDQNSGTLPDILKWRLQGVPHLLSFHYRRSHHRNIWLMYAQVRDFCVSRGSSTVPLTQISCNLVFFKSQNPCKAGTLCNRKRRKPHVFQKRYHSILHLWFVERFWMHRAKEGLYLHLQKKWDRFSLVHGLFLAGWASGHLPAQFLVYNR